MSALQLALDYLTRGWKPLPIPHKNKGCYMDNWQQLQLTTDTVGQHFNGKPQNIGILLGEPSGWLVDIDLDCDETVKLGRSSLPATVAFGRASKPASHLLYVSVGAKTIKYRDPLHPKKQMLVELRSTGGQTVFPGSTHPSGEDIHWEDGPRDPAVVSPADLEAHVARIAVAALLMRYAPGQTHIDSLPEAARSAAAEWLGLARPAPLNAPAPMASSRSLNAVARFNQDHSSTWQWDRHGRQCPVCDGTNSFKALAGDESKWSCFHSSHPDACGGRGNDCHIGDALDLAAYLAGQSRKDHLLSSGYLDNRPAREEPPPPESEYAGARYAITQDVPTKTVNSADTHSLLGFELIHGRRLLDKPESKPLWLVSGLLPEAGVAVIAGEPKSTKTWAAIELAMALATATPAFGEYEVKTRRRVALFLAEDSERSVKTRLRVLAGARGMDPGDAADWMFFICRGQINLLNHVETQALAKECRKLPDLGMIVLDPLRDLHCGEENDSTAMSAVMRELRWLREECHSAVSFIHHASKASKDTEGRRPGQKMRGSSAVHGAVDAGIYLQNTETDLISYWTNKVSVEIKEGAGAGVFSLTLNLNNIDGVAESGSWRVDDVDTKQVSKADKLSEVKEAILGLMANSPEPLGERRLKVALKRRSDTIHEALADLKAAGSVVEISQNGRVCGCVLRGTVPTVPTVPRTVPTHTGNPTVPTFPVPLGTGTVDGGGGPGAPADKNTGTVPEGKVTTAERSQLRLAWVKENPPVQSPPSDPAADALRSQIVAESGQETDDDQDLG